MFSRLFGGGDRGLTLTAEALVSRGALAGLTGPGGDVLKVRPPLVWDESHVDLFVDALAGAVGDAGRRG